MENLEARQTVPFATKRHRKHVGKFGVREVGIVTSQVKVHPCGTRGGPTHAVRLDDGCLQHTNTPGGCAEPVVRQHQLLQTCRPSADERNRGVDAVEPAGRQVLPESADPVEHEVHAPAGCLLHDRLNGLPAEIDSLWASSRCEPTGMVPRKARWFSTRLKLCEQRARPRRPSRHLHPEQPLHDENHSELGGEGGEPVVAVGEHKQLAVVTRLEKLLGSAVKAADLRFARDHSLPVEPQPQPQAAVGRRVVRAKAQREVLLGASRSNRAHPDGHLTSTTTSGHVLAGGPGHGCEDRSPRPGGVRYIRERIRTGE